MMTPEEKLLRMKLAAALALALIAGVFTVHGVITNAQWVQVVLGVWPH